MLDREEQGLACREVLLSLDSVLQTLLPRPKVFEIVGKLPLEDGQCVASLSQHMFCEGGICAGHKSVPSSCNSSDRFLPRGFGFQCLALDHEQIDIRMSGEETPFLFLPGS